MTETVVYAARSILTMHPARPRASHVAVRDGRILGVSSLADLADWGPHTLDNRFADQVLMPGLVEGHCHLMAGSVWRHVYGGLFDATDPAGKGWPGLKTLDAVVAALAQAAAAQPEGPVLGWGFDPIFFDARRCSRADLDRVSSTWPVGVMHASGHIVNVNSLVLGLAGLQRSGVDHPGIPLGSDGLPSGELKGPEAMTPAFGPVGLSRSFLSGDEAGIRSSIAPRWPASRRGRRRRVAWPARWPTCRPRERPSPPFTVAVGHCCTARPCTDPARRPACTRSVIASNAGAPMTQTAPAPTSRPPQRSLRPARRWALLLATAAALASPAHAAFTLFKGTATNPAGLTATRDSFRNLVGGGNTAGANGDFGGVRREINWDGVGNALADPNALPADFFNNTSPRGVVLSTPTPGASFAVSANAGQAVAPLFGFPGDLQTFSAQRLFASVGGRITDIHFFVPGTTTPATTSAFAAIFVDVEDNTATSFTQVEFFDSNNALILSRHAVPAGNQGLSFVGAVAGAGERIARVRITTPDNFVISNGVRANENFDFVVMDDFLYATPLAVPVPETAPWAMALLGLGALGLKARRRR